MQRRLDLFLANIEDEKAVLVTVTVLQDWIKGVAALETALKDAEDKAIQQAETIKDCHERTAALTTKYQDREAGLREKALIMQDNAINSYNRCCARQSNEFDNAFAVWAEPWQELGTILSEDLESLSEALKETALKDAKKRIAELTIAKATHLRICERLRDELAASEKEVVELRELLSRHPPVHAYEGYNNVVCHECDAQWPDGNEAKHKHNCYWHPALKETEEASDGGVI
jgi:hypothetical protein